MMVTMVTNSNCPYGRLGSGRGEREVGREVGREVEGIREGYINEGGVFK